MWRTYTYAAVPSLGFLNSFDTEHDALEAAAIYTAFGYVSVVYWA